MSTRFDSNQRYCVEKTLGTGDTSKELMPAVTGVTYFVTNARIHCLVAAAQTVFVGDADGTNKAFNLPASFPIHSFVTLNLLEGLSMKAGQALIIKPAAAGPSMHVVVEGYLTKAIAP